MEKKKILYIVIPCYNEEAVIRETAKRVAMKMQQLYDQELISELSRVLFVDDANKVTKVTNYEKHGEIA